MTGAVKASGSPKDYEVTYIKITGSDWFTVDEKTGAITAKAGTPKGTYTIGVRVHSAGNIWGNYEDGEKDVVTTITVK